jgi:hypothetical protein
MGRARHCAICTSDPAISGQVNAQIESGVRQKVIHEQFPQFSISQVSRHTRNCLAPKPTGDLSTEQGSQEIAKWLERLDQTFLLAASQGDSKGATQACSAAARTLQSLHRKLEQEAKATKDSVDRDTAEFTIKGCDAMLREYAAKPADFRAIDAQYLLLLGNQQFRQLVSKIWEHKDLLPMLLAAATTNYLAPKEPEHVNTSAND